MWICRYCATHVNDDVLNCPRCATSAPARLHLELTEHMTPEIQETRHREQINWLKHTALPNLRKPAQSPWVWVLLGSMFGLGWGTVSFHGAFVQPILCAAAFTVVFGLFAAVLRWRRHQWQKDTYAVELGAILAFFLPLILAVNDAFINHEGWDSLNYLLSIVCPVIGFGVLLAPFGAIATCVVIPLLKILAHPLGRRFRSKQSAHEIQRIRSESQETE